MSISRAGYVNIKSRVCQYQGQGMSISRAGYVNIKGRVCQYQEQGMSISNRSIYFSSVFNRDSSSEVGKK